MRRYGRRMTLSLIAVRGKGISISSTTGAHACFPVSIYVDIIGLDGRSPDEAKIEAKLLYARSKDALRRSLVGIDVEIQGTDYDEVSYDTGQPR